MLEAFGAALTLSGVLALLLGLSWGTIGGALPGVAGPQAMALLLPLTFAMDATTALMLLAGVWTGANYGGSIPAILIRTPGTASSAAAIVDGNALARRGEAGKALGVSLVCGSIGGFISVVVLIALVLPLGELALKFGPPEICALALFGLTVISTLSGSSLPKGLASGLFGLLLTTVGLDQITGSPRFTFDRPELLGGFGLIAVMIGLFAISEMFYQVAHPATATNSPPIDRKVNTALPSLKELIGLWRATAIGSVSGLILGVAGAGGPVSSFVAYSEAKRWSKRPELFGKGSLEGVAAPETANNSDQGSALVPALALGIPTSASAAVILAALVVQGIQPGPLLVEQHSELVYAFFAALLLSNILMIPVGIWILRLAIRLVSVSIPVLTAGVLVLSVVGTYALDLRMQDALVAVIFGIIGFFMRTFGFSTAAAVLGMVLGYLMEGALRRSMVLSNGNLDIFIDRPVAATILVAAVVALIGPLFAGLIQKHRRRRAAVSN